jgi:hypothetical protein
MKAVRLEGPGSRESLPFGDMVDLVVAYAIRKNSRQPVGIVRPSPRFLYAGPNAYWRTMMEDIRKSESGGRTAYLNIGAWYDPETGHIHLTLPHSGWFHTTVNPEPASKRGHPNLYAKLTRALKEAGVPSPEAIEIDEA